jgi:hypothetical protein
MAGCALFDFSAPEHRADQGASGGGGARPDGGSSGASGASSGTSGTASGGAAGAGDQGGTAGSVSGAAGADEGGAAGSTQGGSSGTGTGGIAGSGKGGMAGSGRGGMAGSNQGGASGSAAGGRGGNGGTAGQEPTLSVTKGLRLWLDATSLTGGGPIATWPNRVSGGETDATQPLMARRPVFTTVGTKPAVQFDGNRWMTFGEGFENFSAGLSFFLVGRFDAPGTCTEIFQVSNGAEIDDISVQTDVMVSDPGVLLFEVENVNIGTEPGVVGGSELSLATIVVGPPEDASISIDGVTARSGVDASFVPRTVARTQNFLGSGLYSNCDPFEGMIFELLLYNRTLTTEDTALVNAYLQAKWNCCEG